jgi:hypothetical protein
MTLVLNGTTGVSAVDGSASTPAIQGNDTNTGMFFPAADTIAFAEGGVECARFDSSGNFGLGVTPSAWGSNFKAVQLGLAGNIGAQTGARTIELACNAYNNSGWKYQATDKATLYYQYDGGHYWSRAASGTAGNAITFTDSLALDSSGNAIWNGTNTTTSNGNVGYVYKFFGAANNIIIPLESSGSNRFGIFEYRRTGRTSARTSQISIGENASSQGEVQVYSSAANADLSGGVVLANGATSWSAISDMRLKTVTGMYTNALQDLAKIQAIKFTWKHDQSNTPQVGVSAQSVELAVPEAISTSRNISTPDDETDYLSVRYTELIPLMIASIQEQQSLITSLTARIAALEGAAQ